VPQSPRHPLGGEGEDEGSEGRAGGPRPEVAAKPVGGRRGENERDDDEGVVGREETDEPGEECAGDTDRRSQGVGEEGCSLGGPHLIAEVERRQTVKEAIGVEEVPEVLLGVSPADDAPGPIR
jgi:hypothetical protein